jgi:hypothetical protein
MVREELSLYILTVCAVGGWCGVLLPLRPTLIVLRTGLTELLCSHTDQIRRL